LLLVASLPGSGVEAAAPYTLAVIPQAPPLDMREAWSPFVERLGRRSGLALRLKLYESFETFENDLAAGGPDLVYTHPAMAVALHRAPGYDPLLRDRRRLTPLVFVRKDSPVRDVRDLEGKRIAFAGSRSYCTVMVTRALREDRVHIRFESQLSGSVRNVMRAVVLGKAEAGASLDASFATEPEELRRELRPVLMLPQTASHPIAVHPRVPWEDRERILAAVLAMAASAGDRPALAAVGLPEPEEVVFDRDYGAIEPLK
jgi:phosphonate transport system substrate-binding protein